MALVKKPVEATTQTAGTFEDDDTTVAAAAVVEQDTKPSAEDKAKVSATVAVAKAQTTAVGAVGKFQTALQSFENALPAIDFGVLPRLKGSNGLILDNDNGKLGSEIQMTLISFNDQYVVTPGEDSDEATKLVKYSSDGITIDETGQAVAEYIQMLVEVEGYKDASVKHYLELVGILNSSEKESEHVGNMVQVSLSPQSRKAFEAHRLQKSVKIRMGRDTEEGAEEIKIKAVVKTMGSFTFTILQVSDK